MGWSKADALAAKAGDVDAVGRLFAAMVPDTTERRTALSVLANAIARAAEETQDRPQSSWNVTIRAAEPGNEKVQLNVSGILATAISCWRGGQDQPRLITFLASPPPNHPLVEQAYYGAGERDWTRCVAVPIAALHDPDLLAQIRDPNLKFICAQAKESHRGRRWEGDKAVLYYLEREGHLAPGHC